MRITQRKLLDMGWLCPWGCVCYCKAFTSSVRQQWFDWGAQWHDVARVIFDRDMRGRLQNYICPCCYYSNWWLKPWQGFLRTSWHPPRPPKHDGWESWVAWTTWGQKKKKRSWAADVYEKTWLPPWNCLLLRNTAASQWTGNPAKMKSVFVSETASVDRCPLAVNELTLCFNQN